MIRQLLKSAKAELATKGISGVDAELLLAHILRVTRMELHSKSIELGEVEAERVTEEFHDLIAQRMTGKPVQYITGEAPFRFLDLDVGPGVLIPRPETEVLVDEVLHQLQRYPDPVSIIDLGSGSGAIAISLVSETAGKKEVHLVAVEKSTEALVWLRQNIAKFDLPIRVIPEDVSTALLGIKCDVVVANPPYIPNAQPLPEEVANFEPEIALRGGVDGMAIPIQFIEAAVRLLKSGGLLALEHHEEQSELIGAQLTPDFNDIKIHYDLAERPRFTTAFRN
jgi:release factor glutamine methyltransferase